MAKRHSYRKYVSLAGKVLGGLVIAGPAITAVSNDIQSGSYQSIGRDVLYGYTGINSDDGSFNGSQAIAGVGSVVGGILLMKMFSYVARRF
jgi:hypothetical protein